jgi:hypothetical protein
MEFRGDVPAALDAELVPGRVCGSCTACCKVPKIDAPSLQKPAGVMCQHCTGSNCGIYESRPTPCRTFFCLWRRVGGMPDELRPDRIGVMFSIESVTPPQNPFEKLFVIGRSINTLADLDSPGARQVVQVFIEQGDLPVWLSHQQQRRLLHPHPALRDAILSPAPPPPELGPQVQLWRKRLGL